MNFRIRQMVTRDQGIYMCEACNEIGCSRDETEVTFGCVKPSHVRISVGDTHPDGYLIGNIALWTCSADGSPNPTFVWYKGNNERNIVSRQASLK